MPHVNGYSFADPSYPWIMHEGLYALLLYAGLSAAGPGFFQLFSLVSGSITIALILGWLFRQSRSPAAGALCALVLFGTTHSFFYPRPLYASLSLDVTMIILVFRPGWSWARAAAVLALELVWTNAHGSFGLGVALVAAGAFDDGRTRTERLAWLCTAAASALVTFVNPYGWHLHGLVDRYLRARDPTSEIIQTHIMSFSKLWDAIADGNFEGKAVFALGLVTVVAVRALVRRRQVVRALVALAGVAMAVYQIRHVVLGMVLGVMLLHGAADELLGPVAPEPRRLRRALWMAGFVVLPGLLFGAQKWRRTLHERPPLAWISGALGGESFLNLSHALPDGARVFAPFKPSALVIWYESPRGVRVLYDPRNDCYSPEVAKGALELDWHHGKPKPGQPPDRRVADFLERYGTEYVITTRGVIQDDLAHDTAWEPWRRSGDWFGFHRKEASPPPAPPPEQP
jgi:hypothetical protein